MEELNNKDSREEKTFQNDDAQSQSDNLNAFGFITNTAKVNIIIAFIALTVLALYYFTSKSDAREEECKEAYRELSKEYLEFTKEQIHHRDSLVEKEKAIERKQQLLNSKINKLKQ